MQIARAFADCAGRVEEFAGSGLRQGQRGVSDLFCGRGRDRKRGQISWSLTPRYRH
jgi:hypothetical protein